MNEYTDGFRLQMEPASGIDAAITVRPNPPSDPLSRIGNMYTLDHVVLPGQAIQIRCFRK
jgi:hypothetical protein